MAVHLKNVKNGEVRSVEAESDEFFDLTRQVFDPGDGTARPAWEQQGFHSKDNSPPIAAGENSGLVTDGPEREPHKNLTPGEREAGLSSWEDKEKQLEEQRNADRAYIGARRQVPGDPGEFSRGEGETSGDPGGSGSGTPPREDVTDAESSGARRSGRRRANAERGAQGGSES